MHAFPMFIKTTGRRVVVVGGGEQAAQKTRLMLKTDARIVLAAPVLDEELCALVRQGRAEHYTGPIDAELFTGAAMAFVATGCVAVDASVHAIATAARVSVNVVDQPDLCDITTPALVDRDPVVIAIGTEGTAPVLARQIKTKLEEDLPQSLGGLSALAGRLRDAVAARVPRAKRRAFWRWVFADAPGKLWSQGSEEAASTLIKSAISQGGAPNSDQNGSISLVGAGPGARDLLTLRAVQRLQEADVIFYDRLVGEDALELARRDAERVERAVHLGEREADRLAGLTDERVGDPLALLLQSRGHPLEDVRPLGRSERSHRVARTVRAGDRLPDQRGIGRRDRCDPRTVELVDDLDAEVGRARTTSEDERLHGRRLSAERRHKKSPPARGKRSQGAGYRSGETGRLPRNPGDRHPFERSIVHRQRLLACWSVAASLSCVRVYVRIATRKARVGYGFVGGKEAESPLGRFVRTRHGNAPSALSCDRDDFAPMRRATGESPMIDGTQFHERALNGPQ